MAIAVTVEGRLEGIDEDGVHAFLGVRYAEPPVGAQRFLPPVPVNPWSGVRPATDYGNRAVQGPMIRGVDLEATGVPYPGEESEDCLFLNLWTPGLDDRRRPVVVWIHGGANQISSPNDYPGSAWARNEDVVVVTIGYRLGIFGFVDLSGLGEDFAGTASGGYRDQIEALRWVHRNIASFGGDPGNVTLIGQSGGAAAVQALLACPSADGLFHRVVACSGGGGLDPSVDATPVLTSLLGVDHDGLLEKLRSMPARDLVDATAALVPAGATIDGLVMTRSVVDAIRDRGEECPPMIAGFNTDEGAMYLNQPQLADYADMMISMIGPYIVGADRATEYCSQVAAMYPDDSPIDRIVRLYTHSYVRAAVATAEAAAAGGVPAWVYRFDMPATAGDWRGYTAHGIEVGFTFDYPSLRRPTVAYAPDDLAVAEVARWWQHALSNFARTGDPNGGCTPRWPRYELPNRESLVVSATPSVETDPGREVRHLWS